MKPAEYLDAVKARLKIHSDYELAKRLEISDRVLPAMRRGERNIPLDMAFKLAITLELDPATVVADLESQREKDEKRRGFWTSFISHARTAAVLLVCMLAWSFSGICGDGSKAGVGFFRHRKHA